jgi:hypothetical protein
MIPDTANISGQGCWPAGAAQPSPFQASALQTAAVIPIYSHLFFFDSPPSGTGFRRRVHTTLNPHEKIFIKNHLTK